MVACCWMGMVMVGGEVCGGAICVCSVLNHLLDPATNTNKQDEKRAHTFLRVY